jgi:ABC-type Zn uptake system ZnuABC Zn-binding protein ZnuA
MRRTFLLLLIILTGLLSGCWHKKDTEKRIQLVSGVHPLKMILHELTGENPELLISQGTDPHAYEMKPSERLLIENADFVLLNGLGIEQFDERGVSEYGKKVFVLSRELNIKGGDPHLWLSPEIINRAVPLITERLCTIFSKERCREIEDRSLKLQAALSLFIKISKDASAIWKKRSMLVTHKVWGRFSEFYGIQQVGGLEDCDTSNALLDVFTNIKQIVETENNHVLIKEKGYQDIKILDLLKELNLTTVVVDSLGYDKNRYSEFIEEVFESISETMT